jgi:hypothetical protein
VAKDVIDFGEVPEEIRGGGTFYVPPGDYLVQIADVEKRWKNDDRSNPAFYRWDFKVLEPSEHKGAQLRQNTSLAPRALFNLRNLIHAVSGKNVAGKKLGFDPKSFVGKKLMVTTEDREYKRDGESRMSADVVDMQSADEWGVGAAASEEIEEIEEGDVEEVVEDELEDVDLDEL